VAGDADEDGGAGGRRQGGERGRRDAGDAGDVGGEVIRRTGYGGIEAGLEDQ
jgi:hypothetical protein